MLLQVTTRQGIAAGVPSGTPGVAVYRGIPYAAPPVGALRWRAPQPPAPWAGVRTFDRFAPAAMQGQRAGADTFYGKEFPDPPELTFSEDCLYLNLWTPAQSPDERLPVMMWIHGGGNMGGYSYEPEFDGEALAAQGVVYVSVGFRLNVFGFLAHPELSAESGYGASGNYGHLDQIAAARWLRDNVAAFGGDPDNITMLGQSGGAHDVQVMATSPAFEGLVHKGISQSGGGAASMMGAVSLQEGEATGLKLQQMAGCANLAELRALPAAALQEAMGKLMAELFRSGHQGMALGSVVDNYVVFGDTSERIRRGQVRPIPLMIGCCSHEGGRMGMLPPGVRQTLAMVNASIDRSFPGAEEAMRQIYGVTTDEAAADFHRDLMADGMVYGYQRWARAQLAAGLPPAYVYLFDRALPDETGAPSEEAAFHSAELWYMHGTLSRCWRKMGDIDRRLSREMVAYWANFARSGDPNGEGLPRWTPYTAATPQTMVLGDTTGMQSLADHPAVRGAGGVK